MVNGNSIFHQNCHGEIGCVLGNGDCIGVNSTNCFLDILLLSCH
jgi:hypothetical protein